MYKPEQIKVNFYKSPLLSIITVNSSRAIIVCVLWYY